MADAPRPPRDAEADARIEQLKEDRGAVDDRPGEPDKAERAAKRAHDSGRRRLDVSDVDPERERLRETPPGDTP